jgi:hypothetical protein
MQKLKKILKTVFLYLGSLRFAVIVIIYLAIISSIGTVIESKYNAEIAGLLIYKTTYMFVGLIAFFISILFSALSRWPWKRKHTPFLVAHLGIIVLIYGSYVTMEYGIDGSLVVPLGQTNQWVSITPKELEVYASYDGQKYTSLYQGDGEFFLNSPKENPIEVPTEEGVIQIVDYVPFALKNIKVVETTDNNFGPGVRFSLSNPNVNVTEWILQRGTRDAVYNLGPAKIILTTKSYSPEKRENSLVLMPTKNKEQIAYTVNYEKDIPPKKGLLKAGDSMDTGWMGLTFQLLGYIERAKEQSEFLPRPRPTERTMAAIKVKYQGEDYWQELNSLLRVFTSTTAYIMSWRNQQIDIGFPVKLLEFKLGKYPGTQRAASYSSVVNVPDLGDVEISMNEPLKHNGYTFYQASFQQDPSGEPTATILSVNYDPGRWIKYLGSLLIVLGSILLFYFRHYYAKAKV